jgi:hypothetical protein
MIAVIVLSAILLVLVVGFVTFFFYSRTQEWGDSEVRRSFLQMLVVVGPLLGMHYKEPRPTPPAVTTPGPDAEPLPGKGDGDNA